MHGSRAKVTLLLGFPDVENIVKASLRCGMDPSCENNLNKRVEEVKL